MTTFETDRQTDRQTTPNLENCGFEAQFAKVRSYVKIAPNPQFIGFRARPSKLAAPLLVDLEARLEKTILSVAATKPEKYGFQASKQA